eukprot:Gb_09676 [translate_table: standard]
MGKGVGGAPAGRGEVVGRLRAITVDWEGSQGGKVEWGRGIGRRGWCFHSSDCQVVHGGATCRERGRRTTGQEWGGGRELCALQLAIKCELLGASPLSRARTGLMDTAAFVRPTLATLTSRWDAPISPSNLAIWPFQTQMQTRSNTSPMPDANAEETSGLNFCLQFRRCLFAVVLPVSKMSLFAGLKEDGGAWRPFRGICVLVESFHSIFVSIVYWQWRSKLWAIFFHSQKKQGEFSNDEPHRLL